jgi:hypothetical protein
MIDMLGRVVAHFAGMVASLTWMQLLLVVGGAFLALVLWMCQRASDDFDLRQLVVDSATGKLDRFAFAFIVGLTFLTWVLLFLANERLLSEWFVGLYVLYCGAPKTIEAYVAARTGKPA